MFPLFLVLFSQLNHSDHKEMSLQLLVASSLPYICPPPQSYHSMALGAESLEMEQMPEQEGLILF